MKLLAFFLLASLPRHLLAFSWGGSHLGGISRSPKEVFFFTFGGHIWGANVGVYNECTQMQPHPHPRLHPQAYHSPDESSPEHAGGSGCPAPAPTSGPARSPPTTSPPPPTPPARPPRRSPPPTPAAEGWGGHCDWDCFRSDWKRWCSPTLGGGGALFLIFWGMFFTQGF